MTFDINHPDVRRAVDFALEEDIRTGDITTDSTIPADLQAEARFKAKQDLTLAGVELLPLLFEHPVLKHASGDRLKPGDEIAMVRGPARLLLTRERVSLNFMQRLSGVATLAAKYVAAVKGTGAKILDTRKTTPGLRVLEKMAGSGRRHREPSHGTVGRGADQEQSHSACRRRKVACERAMKAAAARGITVQVEVRTRAEIEEALACGVKLLLLDNMTPAQAAEEIDSLLVAQRSKSRAA